MPHSKKAALGYCFSLCYQGSISHFYEEINALERHNEISSIGFTNWFDTDYRS